MGEISGGDDDGMNISGGENDEVTSGGSEATGGTGETSSGFDEALSGETASGFGDTGEVGMGSLTSVGMMEVSSRKEAGGTSFSSHFGESGKMTEVTSDTKELESGPIELSQAQKEVEGFHQQSIAQILEINGKYMSLEDQARVAKGMDSIRAVEHDPSKGRTGGYTMHNGKSTAEISAISKEQMERSTKHETNHFASKNREIIVPQPDKNGYMVYNTVGMRQSSWFHSTKTGENSGYKEHGRGINEGLTTMYTNSQLREMSVEKGRAAEQQQIYSHATELCQQLEGILGKDSLKEAYYGGNTNNLEAKVNELAGANEYEHLRDCLDRSISKDYAERIEAMKEAQEILARMSERSKKA